MENPKIRTIIIEKGKVFNSFRGFVDAVKIFVDGVEVASFPNKDLYSRYVLGLRDAFTICGYRVDIVNRIPL